SVFSFFFFFSSRRRHTRFSRDWSSDVCSSDLLSSATFTATTPSAAVRSAFLAAFKPETLRRFSIASSMSPLASFSAFLHSIMPRPVRSRSSFTIVAETAVMVLSSVSIQFGFEKGGIAPFSLHLAKRFTLIQQRLLQRQRTRLC